MGLVESSSKESVPRELRNVCAAPGLLKEIIQGKLALAAAAAVARRHQNDQDMEQTLATAAANFARHNNNDLKDVSKSSVEHQQAFMSQLLKFQALNMSMQNHHSHQNINNKVDSSDNEPPTSPDEAIEKDELEASDVEEEELPIDLQRTSEDGASVQSQTSPRSPSSDAGMSTSSAGKADKASRLEALVSNMQRA